MPNYWLRKWHCRSSQAKLTHAQCRLSANIEYLGMLLHWLRSRGERIVGNGGTTRWMPIWVIDLRASDSLCIYLFFSLLWIWETTCFYFVWPCVIPQCMFTKGYLYPAWINHILELPIGNSVNASMLMDSICTKPWVDQWRDIETLSSNSVNSLSWVSLRKSIVQRLKAMIWDDRPLFLWLCLTTQRI